MLILRAATWLLALATPMPAPPQKPAPSPADQAFATALAEAQNDPEHADFRRLRTLFAGTTHYSSTGLPAFDPAPVDYELTNGERSAALIALDRALIGHWTDISAHDYAINICERIGQTSRESIHRGFLNGLARSILDSGDGRTPDSAWHLIDDNEATLLLRALHCTLESREVLTHNGQTLHRLHVLDTTNPTPRDLYVNVEIPERWRARHPAPPASSRGE